MQAVSQRYSILALVESLEYVRQEDELWKDLKNSTVCETKSFRAMVQARLATEWIKAENAEMRAGLASATGVGRNLHEAVEIASA